ncbi:bifunctional diguanylate cyclase/phosphodiesterase [Arthrobacter sp. CAN_C5]|uniref:putative bifunctional diguanylate cyclase/phosphodiesterase n=1 Tax=Arthrobacter sp. CAN_C5 TaxID=2760706 RepID=UPI001AE1AD24|nr:EAL domain-containing protein [Arthrobacter sp. CAN_C5]MBP2216958.1 diguanylate cyclase (GGDEF)-like protein [Arthrobacter sp. CAN_C5]
MVGLQLVDVWWHGDGPDRIVEGGLWVSAQWFAVALCWLAAFRARARRALVLVSSACSSYAAGTTFYVLAPAEAGSLSADICWLLFYPLILGGLLLSLFRGRKWALSVLLDGLIGALGAAAVLAMLFSPILPADRGVPSWGVAATMAYPLFDLLFLAVAAGIAGVPGLAGGRQGLFLMLGFGLFAAADVLYAFRVSGGGHQSGIELEAGWTIGLCLVAMWADLLGRPGRGAASARTRSWAPVVPAVATAAGLGVLVVGTRVAVSDLVVGLAGMTLLTAGARTQLAFRQLVTLGEVRRQSRTDELTGLPNRRALYADVPERLKARKGSRSAFLLLDVDRFKEVNDSLGHDVGDVLLTQIGDRLSRCLRAGDLIARIGGDEFAILLDGAGGGEARRVAVKLQAAFAAPFTLEGIALQISLSVGIALFPEEGNDLKVLMRKADMAMYKAKSSRSGHHVFVREDNCGGEERLRTLQELRTALADNEFVLHYQPKIDLNSGRIEAVEALVRWDHPRRGLLYPDSFLFLTEEAGLMNDLTDRVLNLALNQAAVWQSQGNPLSVAVNLPAGSLIDTELPDRILTLTQDRLLPPSALMLEITEESLILNISRAKDVLHRLKDGGIRVAIDDFGTGYSSLAYLRDLPISELKLDRSFILPMSEDPRAAALVASTINLAHTLGLTVVAEGVESASTLDQLARAGCDQAQGFHILGPVQAAALDDWMAARCSHQDPRKARTAPDSL